MAAPAPAPAGDLELLRTEAKKLPDYYLRREEMLRNEIRTYSTNVLRVAQWGVTVLVATQTAIAFLRREIGAGYRGYRTELNKMNVTGIPEFPVQRNARRYLNLLYFVFPVFDLFARLAVHIKIEFI
jgi:hypothetical protein